ncbi:phage portal protein [Rhodococcus sp. NPDC003348]
MDINTARHYLRVGEAKLLAQEPQWQRRQNYLEGKQDLPFAPEGVNAEYLALREQAIANWMGIAMNSPIQRLQATGFRDGVTGKVDLDVWKNVIQPNQIDARQPIVFQQMMVHGRGIWGVSRNRKNPARPIITVENCRRVWIEPDPYNPFEPLFAVKKVAINDQRAASQLVLPTGYATGPLHVAYVYDATSWMRFTQRGAGTSTWEAAGEGRHGLGRVPFVASDANVDADGVPHSSLDALIPQQDALNTIRFNTLLAMQFSAYRQRVFTGYDPVIRDEAGQPLLKKDPAGNVVFDENGHPIPLLNSPGRIGVDRALVFPGDATKVFDLPESNLKNYIEVYSEFLSNLFATGQIPPQYLLSRMANLSGDALTGAESTLKSLIGDLKLGAGEALETTVRLANIARGAPGGDDYASEVVWAETEARSFAQIVDAIVKLISAGFPRRSGFEMIPGATPTKVDSWMAELESERQLDHAVVERAMRSLEPQPTMEGASDVDLASGVS